MLAAAVVTTFPSNSWKVYSERMLQSFTAYWPKEIPLLVNVDDDLLTQDIQRILRESDGLKAGWEKDHLCFVTRNKDRDHPTDYRMQATRFCHKVFALKYSLDSVNSAKAAGAVDTPRYLIWLDADVLTTRPVSIADIEKCLPKEGDAASYLGRKDWPHSECGWLAFDLENGGDKIIDLLVYTYTTDNLFLMEQWHDSWAFDHVSLGGRTNLTPDATGMEVWPQSPLASFSRHYKGPVAKNELAGIKPKNTMQPLRIQTRNSIPDKAIQDNIVANQAQIKNWVRECRKTDDEIVVVSAGPMLLAEDLLKEVAAGRKIVAVKHALEPLKEAGIRPWACILLDPRDHMTEFTENPDTEIVWLVASQVMPAAVRQLLDAGCNVWGYHAAVGAGEEKVTSDQADAIVSGGSATATRGLYVLEKLGFRKFRLYGYDLCVADKPDLNVKDDLGQPKYFEVSLDANMPHYRSKRAFWSTGELLAQYEEFKNTILTKDWDVTAFGNGIAPFIANAKRVSDLRGLAKKAKMPRQKIVSYEDLLCKTLLWTRLRKRLRKVLPRRIRAASF